MANEHLWLVDDSPELGIIVGRHCRLGRQALTGFVTAEPAWEALAGGAARPDLILLDVNLPGLSGLELLRRIRQHDDLRRLTVALFCHPGLVHDLAQGWAAGADYLFAKDLVTDLQGWARRM